jgi:hypothetical protein
MPTSVINLHKELELKDTYTKHFGAWDDVRREIDEIRELIHHNDKK